MQLLQMGPTGVPVVGGSTFRALAPIALSVVLETASEAPSVQAGIVTEGSSKTVVEPGSKRTASR